MNRGLLVLATAAAAGALTVSVFAGRARDARDDLAAAAAARDRVAGMAADVRRLAERPPVVAGRGTAEESIPGTVTSILVAAGLAPDRLQSSSVIGDVAVTPPAGVASPGAAGTGEPAARRQTVAVQLRGVTPADLGRFLAAWRSRLPTWTPTLVELASSPARGRTAVEGTYSVSLTVESLYVETGP